MHLVYNGSFLKVDKYEQYGRYQFITVSLMPYLSLDSGLHGDRGIEGKQAPLFVLNNRLVVTRNIAAHWNFWHLHSLVSIAIEDVAKDSFHQTTRGSCAYDPRAQDS